MYRFALLDPRPQGADANAKVLARPCHTSEWGDEECDINDVLGIEVTVPALAEKCDLGNIDPQHSGGNADLSAIEEAMTWPLPPGGATLVTVRADMDSIGAMAVLAERQYWLKVYGDDNPVWDHGKDRIMAVAAADKFARGPWPGVQPLPTADNPWPKDGTRELAAIAAAVADHTVPLETRVQWMREWLLKGIEPGPPKDYRLQVESLLDELVIDLADGRIIGMTAIEHPVTSRISEAYASLEKMRAWEEMEIRLQNIAVVETPHRAATMIGYHLAPVVVAMNPKFRFNCGEPHRKYTVCQYTPGYVDMPAVLAALQELESGWDGSPTIIGSPQGVASTLDIETVVGIVANHMITAAELLPA